MSDLQLSLLVIGAVVVAGVYLYNWLQERGYRRRMSQAFGAGPDDVLLKAGVESALTDGRLEPQLVPPDPLGEADEDTGDAPDEAEAGTGTEFDGFLDYVAEIEATAPIAGPAISELAHQVASCGKPVRIAGLDAHTGSWEDVTAGRGGPYRGLRLALQLVNRAGAVNAAQLSAFCDAVRSSAERIAARADCPDTQEALRRARDLDAFSGDVDVAVGVNVVAADGAAFPGTKIRAAAEAAGFKLESDGVFHYRNEQRETLFTLDNHEPAPFLPESMKGLTTRGITFLMDVPRVANGAGVLDQMLGIAGDLAAHLGGNLVDDNRSPLTEAGLARIKDQVRSIHARMDLHGIPAGGARALRLFS